MAYERVTLYGVPLVADRLVSYGKVDRRADAASCSSGTRWSTASGRTRHRFTARNRRLLEEAEELEHRARRRDIVVDEHTLFDFYDARVGAEVVSGAHFDKWWKQERRERARPAHLRPGDAHPRHRRARSARRTTREHVAASGEGLTFPISYHFEPGAAEDGLTIDVPVATLNRVEADDFSWNVPGPARGAGDRLIRSPAQEPAGQLRAGAQQGPGVPGRRAGRGRSRCSTRWSGTCARPPASSYRARPGTGRRCPSTCARPTGWSTTTAPSRRAARTSRRSRRRCARSSPQAMAEVAADSRARRAPARPTWAFGTDRASRSPRPAPATRCAASRRWSTRATTVGLRVFGSEAEQEARHRLGVRRLLLLDAAARRSRRSLDGLSTTPTSSGWPARRTRSVAELLEDCRGRGRRRARRRTARRCATRRRSTRCAAAARADRRRAVRPPGRARRAAGARRLARRPTRLLSGPRRHGDAAGAGRHEGAARRGWCTAGSSPRPGPSSCARYPRYLGRRRAPAASGSAAGARQPRPAADGPGRRAPGGLPAPGRRAARGPPAERRPASRCAGCSRSTGSACGPSTSAPPTPSPTTGSARPSTPSDPSCRHLVISDPGVTDNHPTSDAGSDPWVTFRHRCRRGFHGGGPAGGTNGRQGVVLAGGSTTASNTARSIAAPSRRTRSRAGAAGRAGPRCRGARGPSRRCRRPSSTARSAPRPRRRGRGPCWSAAARAAGRRRGRPAAPAGPCPGPGRPRRGPRPRPPRPGPDGRPGSGA